MILCTNCKNSFHHNCLTVWAESLRQQSDDVLCPLCRAPWPNAPCREIAPPLTEPCGEPEQELPQAPLVCLDSFRFARPWVLVYGEHLVSCLLSAQWSVRELALRKLRQCVKEIGDSSHLPVTMAILEKLCADPVFKVYETALHVFSSLLPVADPAMLVPVVDRILLKSSDRNRPTRCAFYSFVIK